MEKADDGFRLPLGLTVAGLFVGGYAMTYYRELSRLISLQLSSPMPQCTFVTTRTRITRSEGPMKRRCSQATYAWYRLHCSTCPERRVEDLLDAGLPLSFFNASRKRVVRTRGRDLNAIFRPRQPEQLRPAILPLTPHCLLKTL